MLFVNPASDSFEIDSLVANGAVTLTGTVQSWHEKQLAEKLTKGVRGVQKIDNQIAIKYTHSRSDEEIGADVKSKWRWDRFVDDALIDVKVDNSTVTLSCEARSNWYGRSRPGRHAVDHAGPSDGRR